MKAPPGPTRDAVHRSEDLLLGRLAVRENVCSQEQVNECLQIQAMTRSDAPLGDLLLFKGFLTADQLKSLLGRQHKKVMACSACRLSFTVVTLSDGKSARCPRCKGTLEEAGRNHPTRTDAEFSTQRIRTKPSLPGPLRKSVCIICDHEFEAALDPSGRVRCPACQSTFSPK
jgi:uncharacterized CHY-type Zn-finger protein